MSLETQINQDIKAAMIAKDTAKLRGLRAIKAAILLAKTEKGGSEEMSEDTEIKVLQKLVKQRKESAEIYQQQNRNDLYQIEIEEQEVIEGYLPKQLDRTAIEEIIKGIIAETGASSVKEMGKVMGLANQKLAGQADGRTISEVVKSLLS
ncbi:GatB/YqeY domain-containing protein [Sphingobacterium sp. DK4209]|uniref:GatB/YqeY domain-containing protein n=1 Tax=Sphingobacterium zhuxiongii TaxID=2662364 RepID=A0A5Q0QD84_9SPHI|nr:MULTISPECIES: GatB/YqeY domain-containing protein [unclassified Sphingobacterium]MVZ64330.1 GatB/YqeY domain-containing protein [Sphingobacterium sp. DK4209]QGA25678.1 GatB/YqeY domain-containing protein [Sphingobacterium sp. dk4302]